MMYLQKHSKRSFGSFLKIIFIFSFIFFLIFLINISPARSFLSGVLSPVFGTGSYFYMGLNYIGSFFSKKSEIIRENEILKMEIQNLRLLNIAYNSTKIENERLKKELALKPPENFISTRIIARPPQIPSDSIFIDSGIEYSVYSGAFVTVSDRIMIGKIVENSFYYSTLVLNSYPGTISYGSVERTGEPLEIEGVGGGGMKTRLPIDFDIKNEDKIIVEGFYSYIIAIVRSIEHNESSGFKEVFLSLPVDMSRIKIVFVEPLSRDFFD